MAQDQYRETHLQMLRNIHLANEETWVDFYLQTALVNIDNAGWKPEEVNNARATVNVAAGVTKRRLSRETM
jgi:hypothetical protein